MWPGWVVAAVVDALGLELAARMPWTVAEGGTLWIATGMHNNRGDTFRDCLVRCVPSDIHGGKGPFFEALLYGEVKLVHAADITRAREVLLVWADDPLRTVDPDDQPTVDYAVRNRGAG